MATQPLTGGSSPLQLTVRRALHCTGRGTQEMHNIHVEVQLDGDAIGWRWTCKNLEGAEIHVVKPFGVEAQSNWCNIVQLFDQTICTQCTFVSPPLLIVIIIIYHPHISK